MSPTPPISTVEGVVEGSLARIANAIAQAPADSPPAALARPALRDLNTAWAIVRAELDSAAPKAATIVTDPTLNDNGRNAKASAHFAATTATVDAELATMTSTAEQLISDLQPLARPPRPAGSVVEQEAILAGLKADLRMVLDRIEGDQPITERLEQYLRSAVVAGDTLQVWLLASSGWVPQYLEARNVTRPDLQWGQRLADVLDVTSTGDIKVTLELLSALEDTYGLNGVLQGTAAYAGIALDDLRRAMRLSTYPRPTIGVG